MQETAFGISISAIGSPFVETEKAISPRGLRRSLSLVFRSDLQLGSTMRSIAYAEVRGNGAIMRTGTIWVPKTITILFFANFDLHEPF